MKIIINSTLIVECLDDRGFTDLNVAEIQLRIPNKVAKVVCVNIYSFKNKKLTSTMLFSMFWCTTYVTESMV